MGNKIIQQIVNIVMEQPTPGFVLYVSDHGENLKLISRMIKTGRKIPPSWVQVTDFDLHGLWIHDHMTGYFAASEEVAFRMPR